jgi:predicted transcriptional regulator
MAIKQWFVTLYRDEICQFKNPFERLVYEAVKSFCANGRIEAACSTREIAKRATLSQTTVYRYLTVLLSRGFIIQTGSEGKVGGTVPVYKVIPPESVSDSHSKLSDSGHSSNLNNIKDNKDFKKETALNDFWQKTTLLSNEVRRTGGYNNG